MGLIPFLSPISIVQQKPDKKTSSPWAVCTHQERVSHPLLSHTEDLFHHGKSNLPKRSRTSSTSSPRRVTSHHSLVSILEILTVLVRPTTWLDPRSSVFSNPWELPQNFQKISTMIKRAVGMRKHLERNRKDKDGKFRLILIESRIHRLSRYYRAKGIVPPTFKYESATASALVA